MGDPNTKGGGLNRREAIAGLIGGGIGALAPVPVEASHPVHHHLASPAALGSAREAAASADWAPAFLSAHQNETLAAVAERIVPGATEAGVSRFVDKLLDVDTQDTQRAFLESLSAFEAAALAQFGRPFVKLETGEQDRVLESAAAPERERADRETNWGWFGVSEASSPSEGLDLGLHLRNLKGWISGAYYSSEKGMKELGWTGEKVFDGFPGCSHGSHG